MQLMMQKAIIDKEFKAFSKKSKKMRPRRIPEVFRFNRSAVGIQRKRVQLAECDLARGVSAVALKRVHLVQYFISSCFILYHFLAKDIRAVALLTFKRVQLVQHFIFQGWNERWTSGTNVKVKILSMNWQACTKFTLCIRCTPSTLTQLLMKIHKQMVTGIESKHWSWLTFSS